MEEVTNLLGLVWPFVLLIAIFYFFMYRPQKKAQLKRGRFLLSMKKGDHVVTSGGVHGVIKVLRDKYVELEVAPKVIIKVEKAAIHHGDVELIDEKTALDKGAQEVGAAAERQENNMDEKKGEKPADTKKAEEDPNTKVITDEKVIEVDDPKDAGVEVVDEVVSDKKDAASDKEK